MKELQGPMKVIINVTSGNVRSAVLAVDLVFTDEEALAGVLETKDQPWYKWPVFMVEPEGLRVVGHVTKAGNLSFEVQEP